MAIHVALQHRSHYTYDRPVGHSPHVVRLRPAPHCRTPILSYSLKILPKDHFINWQQDPFSNYQARLVFPEKAGEFLVEVDLVAEMSVYNPFDFFLEASAEKVPFAYEPALRKELAPFIEATPAGPLFTEFLKSVPRVEQRSIDFLVQLNQRLWKDIKYLIRLEPGVQTPEETLTRGSGSCRDSGWLLVQAFRHLGLAARFVSGYLIQLKPDVKSLDGPSGAEHDFTDLHAWAEVYLPGAGWIGLDPTSGLFAGEGHIPLACTPEPSAAAPIAGLVDKCESKFTHEMKVTRIFESPRVTKPYTEEQWQEIETLGHKIDGELRQGDVRLTMGGEPTFVSIDNMDGEEWNFTAVGPEKRRLSDVLLRRLHKQFAPGGLLHHGQGKWYPGESLPRWAFGCYWRKDGQPVWHDASLFAEQAANYGHSDRDSQRFIHRLAQVLNVKPKHILPAYEDAWYYMWRERRLPTNVDPLEARLENKEERARLARVFAQGLNKVVGHVLPIQRARSGDQPWTSGPWFLRPEHLFLIPGDSPIGLRLPLDSLPWVAATDYPYVYPPDLASPELAVPLPEDFRARVRQRGRVAQPFIAGAAAGGATGASGLPGPVPVASEPLANEKLPKPRQSADWIVRTAICVEPRDGKLHVFMPPVSTTEDYLELIAAIEETATELKLPVVIEGGTPPHDPRLTHIKVTPDPGVIEVNLQPAHTWDELVRNTTVLYEEARQSRLGTEKFMIDGRHVGTGGGNHVVIGGATPSDSPILRRPDLLKSMVCYWQNHPSLSFLFSGLFIGPTSQHPRVDEARNDALYELE
ncbi:MAG TPA: transglutaminase family protein, partial [Verrucomicrobiae bacterium]|nr:transglutaminase family protein [Verrucomicrobiae bacterium]